MEAVSKAASDSLEAINRLTALHDTNVQRLPKTNRSKDNLRAVFDYIEQYPIIDIKRTAKELEVSYNTVAAAVKNLWSLVFCRKQPMLHEIEYLPMKSTWKY